MGFPGAVQCTRKGNYAGKVLVLNEQTERAIRYIKFDARFQDDNETLLMCLDLGECIFRSAGKCNIEVYFFARDGDRETLKGEYRFSVVANAE